MAQIQKIQCETEVKCSADKFYATFKNNVIHLPQLLPETYKSVQVIEGDGKNLGTVRLWKYVIGGNILALKEKVEAMDDENRSITMNFIGGDFIGGDILNSYNSIRNKLDVTPIANKGTSADGCLVKWTLEFEKANEDVPTPDMYLDICNMTIKEMARHLL